MIAPLQKIAEPARVVFLFDVDNTLLDNDRVTEDLKRHLEREVSPEHAQRYWKIFDLLRLELGYSDYLGALERYRSEFPRHFDLLTLSRFLIDYPFANRLFPNSLDVIERAKQWGPTAILSDGDVVFQPRKMDRAELFEAVNGNVLIYPHKELELEDVECRYPARHYVLLDDKLRILTAAKNVWGEMVTTIFVRQGQYATDPEALISYPPSDLTLERISDFLLLSLEELLLASARPAPPSMRLTSL